MALGISLGTHGPLTIADYVDITVVGAGPAGSTAALMLARAGWQVRLVDKDRFPRSKLCGEFLSGEGVATLRDHGLGPKLWASGARPVGRLLVTTRSGSHYGHTLTNGAVGITRTRLDAMLLEAAARAGAQAVTGTRVRSVSGSLEEGFLVSTDAHEWKSQVVVGAFGRSSTLRRVLGGSLGRKPRDPLVAFKSYVTGSMDDGVVELHSFRDGYCGLLRTDAESVNVCWITRVSALRAAGGKPDRMINASLRRNKHLDKRLGSIDCDDLRFYAASQLSLRPQSTAMKGVLMVGDAAGMIAPMCGDGMAMAIESAALLTPLVQSFMEGKLDSDRLRFLYGRAWTKTFARRMRLGRLLHHGFMNNAITEFGVRMCDAAPTLGQYLVDVTRGQTPALRRTIPRRMAQPGNT